MTMTISGDGTIGGLVAGGLPNATVQAADLAANAVDAQALSLLNASGSAPVYACRAWVNFNGQGTVAIRASGNVSSITDLGTGRYQVNFTTAMPDGNYAVNIVSAVDGTYGLSGQIKSAQVENTGTILTTSCVVGAAVTNTTASADSAVMCASFFR